MIVDLIASALAVTASALAMGGEPECVACALNAGEVFASSEAIPRTSAAQAPETTVWTGAYTEEQATRGERIYQRRCRKCHRNDLSGDGALQGDGSEVVPSLVGVSFELRWDTASVADLFLTVSRAMPWDAPGTVGPRENIDVVGYLLKMNGIPSGDAELPTETEQLDRIRITAQPPGE